MNLRTAICPRKARKIRKVIGRDFRAQCRSGFATPTETFQRLNRLRNVSDGVANPVTLSEVFRGQEASFALVPKLLLGNPVNEALGNCSLRCSTSCIHAVAASRVGKLELPRLHSQAGAWERAKRREKSLGKFFVLFVSFVDKKL